MKLEIGWISRWLGVTLIEQVENGKILDKGHAIKTPSAGNKNDPTEVVETFGSTNH